MNNELRPYDEYKKVPFQWLDSIPLHWEYKRAKAMYSKANRPVREMDEVVTCFRDGMVTLRKNRRTTGFTESIKEIGYQGIRKGDLVIHVMDAFAGAVGVSDSDGKSTPVYSVCVPKEDLNNNYYAYIVREMAKTGFIQSLYRGIRERSSDFRFEVFANQYLPIPPIEEQDQIVKYLNFHLTKINKFIKAKKKLIEVLKEQKQVIISEAVTKGINPNVKMKQSEIEWLGDIPEHWECRRLKTALQNITINTNKKLPEEIYIGLENVEGWTGKFINVSANAVFDSQVKKFTINNILFGKLRPYLAKVVKATQNGVCSGEFLVLKLLDKKYSIKYLEILLRSSIIIDIITGSTYGAKMPRAEWGFIGSLKVALPSTIKEQDEIVSYIAKKVDEIDKSIKKIEKEIDLITEYRIALISDIVTGKVDVRHIEIDAIMDEDTEIDETEDELVGMDEILDNDEE